MKVINIAILILAIVLMVPILSCSVEELMKNEADNFPNEVYSKYYNVLYECDVFTSNTVGSSNTISKYAVCFTKLYHANDIELFKRLFNEAKNIEGKMYALVGLHELETKTYDLYSTQLDRMQKVTSLIYGEGMSRSIGSLLDGIENCQLIEDIVVMEEDLSQYVLEGD